MFIAIFSSSFNNVNNTVVLKSRSKKTKFTNKSLQTIEIYIYIKLYNNILLPIVD